MRKLDFLSQSPNSFIFQKESNKTTFGGAFSVIYLISIFFIFLYFRTIYAFSDPYEITSFISEEKRIKNNEQKKFTESKKYNPILPMKFSILDAYGKNLNDKFIIVDMSNNITIERDKLINKRVDDINFAILYKCDETNNTNKTACEIEDKDKVTYIFQFIISYQGFYYRPQSSLPVHQLFDNDFHLVGHIFNPDIKLRKLIRWTITRYEDNRGLWQIFDYFKEEEPENIKENNIFIGGSFENVDTMIIDKNTHFVPRKNNTQLLFMFQSMKLEPTYNLVLYKDYKRKSKSILDCYANIFSLWISLYNGFTFIFLKLYSKSFDKYKIIENILSRQKKNLFLNKELKYHEKKIKANNKGDILLEDFIEKEHNDDQILISDTNIIKEKESSDINSKLTFNEKDDEQERILPKLSFLDFFYNAFYKEKCCIDKRQKLIEACNKIMFQYYSVENILYNQIMLENLFKDYKWNNPELKNIFNNNSLYYIKNNLLNNYY